MDFGVLLSSVHKIYYSTLYQIYIPVVHVLYIHVCSTLYMYILHRLIYQNLVLEVPFTICDMQNCDQLYICKFRCWWWWSQSWLFSLLEGWWNHHDNGRQCINTLKMPIHTSEIFKANVSATCNCCNLLILTTVLSPIFVVISLLWIRLQHLLQKIQYFHGPNS